MVKRRIHKFYYLPRPVRFPDLSFLKITEEWASMSEKQYSQIVLGKNDFRWLTMWELFHKVIEAEMTEIYCKIFVNKKGQEKKRQNESAPTRNELAKNMRQNAGNYAFLLLISSSKAARAPQAS